MGLPIFSQQAWSNRGTVAATLIVIIGLLVGPGIGRADGPAKTRITSTQPAATRPITDVSFYGSHLTNVHRVIFLVDTSGSMIGVFGDVKARLKQTVYAMKSTDDCKLEFNIITFSDEQEAHLLFKDGPQEATGKNTSAAADFIDDQVASGGTLPMPAIKAALAIDPPADGIFLLTDGFDNVASFEDITDAFKEATKNGKLKVNCVHFVAEPDPKLVEVLKEIAEESHGEFKQIQKSDMQ